MSYIDHAKEILKEKKLRVTKSRTALLETLSRVTEPVNAYDLSQKMEEIGEKIDVVTVYRILNVLEQIGLVHRINKGYLPCQDFECENKHHCHHHFICTKCRKVTELHVDDQHFLQKIEKNFSDLLINAHNFEFSGFCGKCKK